MRIIQTDNCKTAGMHYYNLPFNREACVAQVRQLLSDGQPRTASEIFMAFNKTWRQRHIDLALLDLQHKGTISDRWAGHHHVYQVTTTKEASGPTPSLPEIVQLLRQGKRVWRHKQRSGDLEFFSTEEEDLRGRIWVEIELPTGAFGCNFTPDEIFGKNPLPPHEDEVRYEQEREENIREWQATQKNWEEALKQSPIIAEFDGIELRLVDGWHRTKMARDAGVCKVRTCVGMKPKVYAQLMGR